SASGSVMGGSSSANVAGASGSLSAVTSSFDTKGLAATPSGGRKRKGGLAGNAQTPGAPGSSKRRSKGAKSDGLHGDAQMQMQAGAMGYGQQASSTSALQQPANPATATPDELAFFERVKRFIGQPSAYNEFLKLLNLYNQQVLDPKTLVERAESFIGDDQELFGWFKQFVGFDEQQQAMDDSRSGDEAIIESIVGSEPGAYMTPEEVSKTLRPTPPKVSLSQCKAYGPSYRLLPESSAQSKCSGRDAMCYEVLNDRWASHPTWASEDTDFVHHKKNVYEEAMFRSEEDRHEMDIEIDTNLS
ncbi:Transcriptional regulatory protein sin3, partial [Coemansia sp. RSA 2607]